MDILDDILSRSEFLVETKDFSFKNFKKNYIKKKQAVLLKGYANNWKAKQDWDFDFLSNLDIDKNVRIEVGNVIQNETKVEHLGFKSYINQIINSKTKKDKDQPYLSMFNLFDYYPDLIDDTDLSILTKHTKLNFPGVWIGPAGTISGFHWDSSDNVLTQIEGKKLVLIASPKYSKDMYQSKKFDHDATGSCVDINNYDEKKYPKFKDVEFFKVILEPGDSLYLPGGWWHYVKSLDASISVSNFGYSVKDMFKIYLKEFVLLRLHMRGYYRTDNCTCHVTIDGKRVTKGR